MPKNKKILGVFNALDIVIIILALGLILPAIHYYIRFNEKGYAEERALNSFIRQRIRENAVSGIFSRTKMLDINVTFKNLTKADVEKVMSDDMERSPDGAMIAQIMEVGSPVPNYFVVDIGSTNEKIFTKTVPEGSLYSLPAKLRIKGTISDSGLFTYKDKSVKELELFKFKCDKYEAYFTVETPDTKGL